MDAAEQNMNISMKELEGAETFLKDAEKRWEVIDDDSADEPQNKKRRKVSLPAEEASDRPLTKHGCVLVEGCGLPEANGTYEYEPPDDGSSLAYLKKGKWNGKDATFKIIQTFGMWLAWCIRVNVDGDIIILYRRKCEGNEGNEHPPRDDWKVMQGSMPGGYRCEGESPAPKLTYLQK